MTAAIVLAIAVLAGCSAGGSVTHTDPTTVAEPPSAADPAVPGVTSAGPSPSAASTSFPPAATPAPDTASTASADPSVVLGSVLKTYLPTATSLPPGWALDTTDSDEQESDSGAQVLSRSSVLGLPTAQCSLLSNMNVLDGYAAYATVEVEDTGGKYHAQVTVASFSTGGAANQLAVIRAFMARCPSYVASGMGAGGSDVQVLLTAKPVVGLGDEGLDVKILPQGGYVGNETVLVRIGDRVLSVRCAADRAGQFPDVTSLARQLAKSVR
ncbi:hypothetical protein [Kitasatospora sp. NBC_01266]|uniref:hypothetical protein n=1 Tax=Kitasatospora sp. NBC_01266 TaxID=2903572 RepID=UPI002E3002DC|nr:hypothetical protein [Kitasatospora sp. NBC_01266]